MQFDAASVRLGDNTFRPGVSLTLKGGPGTEDPGRITYTQVRLKLILMKAYGVRLDQLSGPGWIMDAFGDDSYTITATMPPGTTEEQFQEMLQNLLADRFHLKVHHETKKFPGYELTADANGLKLVPTNSEPHPPGFVLPTVPTDLNTDGSIKLPVGIGMSAMPGHLAYRGGSMSDLVMMLLPLIRDATAADCALPSLIPRIVDKTSLSGRYDFTLDYSPAAGCGVSNDAAARLPFLAGANGVAPPVPEGSSATVSHRFPDLFQALEKQLGLRLRKTTDIPVDVIVVDAADRAPSVN